MDDVQTLDNTEEDRSNRPDIALDLSISHEIPEFDPVSSYVFFDTETTGLLDAGHKPKITELCFLAVQRGDLHHDGLDPRVTQKLLICLNPRKAITPTASMITGLFNDSLEGLAPFNKDVVKILTLFLERLPQPVCLIAHNGNGFDYPLLRSELLQIGSSLPSKLLCADSLECFRRITSEKAAAEMLQGTVELRKESEQTPSKRAASSNSEAVCGKRPRKEYSGKNPLCCESDGKPPIRKLTFDSNIESQTAENSKSANQLGGNSVSSSSSVVRKLTFMDSPDSSNMKFRVIDKPPSQNSVNSLRLVPPTVSQSAKCIDNFAISQTDYAESASSTSSLYGYSQETIDYSLSGADTVDHLCDNQGGSLPDSPDVCTSSNHKLAVSDDSIHGSDQRSARISKPSDDVKVIKKAHTFQNMPHVDSLGDEDLVNAIQDIETKYTSIAADTREAVSKQTPECSSILMNEDGLVPITCSKLVSQDILSDKDVKYSNSYKDTIITKQSELSIKDKVCSIQFSPTTNSVCLPVTKYSPIVAVSPISRAHMRNENQLSSDIQMQPCASNLSPNLGTTTTKSSPMKVFPSRVSHKLEDIYRRTFGVLPPVAHTAEDDCLALLKVVRKHSPYFLDWVDRYAKPFNSLDPMYT